MPKISFTISTRSYELPEILSNGTSAEASHLVRLAQISGVGDDESVPLFPEFPEQLLSWNPQLVGPLPFVAVAAFILYVIGVARVLRTGSRWSVGRTISFLVGCLILLFITGTGVESYGGELFSVFMFQQLTLMMVVPPLLVVGSPARLFLRATPHRGVGTVLLRAWFTAFRSGAARFIIHPALVVPILLTSYFGLYLSGAADWLLRSAVGRSALEVTFLLLGLVLAVPLLSAGPLPRRSSHVVRIFDAFIEMQVHAALGLVLAFSSVALVPYFAEQANLLGVDALRDQQLTGALVWTYGEIPVIAILIVAMVRWGQRDTQRAAKALKRADAEGDPDWDEYNRYLQRLQGGGGSSGAPAADARTLS